VFITPHFTDAETVAGLPPGTTVPDALRPRVLATAALLERARAVLGVPLVVTSWYRTPEHNAEVAGVSRSQHLTGAAADVIAQGLLIGDALDRFMAGVGRVSPFGQAIFYADRGHIHLSTRDGTSAVDSVLVATDGPGGTMYAKAADPRAAGELPRGTVKPVAWSVLLVLLVFLFLSLIY